MKHYNLQIDPEADYNNPEDCCIIWPSGKVGYYSGDLAHRLDGPAVIYKDGTFDWYINGGRCFTNKQYKLAAGLTDEEMAILVLKYGNVR